MVFCGAIVNRLPLIQGSPGTVSFKTFSCFVIRMYWIISTLSIMLALPTWKYLMEKMPSHISRNLKKPTKQPLMPLSWTTISTGYRLRLIIWPCCKGFKKFGQGAQSLCDHTWPPASACEWLLSLYDPVAPQYGSTACMSLKIQRYHGFFLESVAVYQGADGNLPGLALVAAYL